MKSIDDQVNQINNKIDNNTETLQEIMNGQQQNMSQLNVRANNTNRDGVYQDCEDAYSRGSGMSGVYHILPGGSTCEEPIQVFCDMNTTGKWIVFQDVKMDQSTFIETGLTMSMGLETWKGSTGWDWTRSPVCLQEELY